MAETLKNLGQALPASSLLSNLYTVPALTSAAVSSIVICNQGSTVAKFRVAHAITGSADATKQYLYYDQEVPPKKTFIATVGLSLSSSDVIRVASDNGLCSFNLYGAEVS